MPGASAYGTLANKPMTSVPTTAEMMVARNTAPHSIPAWLRIDGLTAIMYAIVKKVVSPAMISFGTVEPFALILNIDLSPFVIFQISKARPCLIGSM